MAFIGNHIMYPTLFFFLIKAEVDLHVDQYVPICLTMETRQFTSPVSLCSARFFNPSFLIWMKQLRAAARIPIWKPIKSTICRRCSTTWDTLSATRSPRPRAVCSPQLRATHALQRAVRSPQLRRSVRAIGWEQAFHHHLWTTLFAWWRLWRV